MKKVNIAVEYMVYESAEDLNESDRSLLDEAGKAVAKAYAPYSTYHVGAAVLLENGEVITGNNQENIAYPSGLCAERVALFYAASQNPEAIVKTIAITAGANGFKISEPVTPCGSCRQVMAETENKQEEKIRVIMKGETGRVYITNGIENLLPLMFHAVELKK